MSIEVWLGLVELTSADVVVLVVSLWMPAVDVASVNLCVLVCSASFVAGELVVGDVIEL